MHHHHLFLIASICICFVCSERAEGCTNVIVTKGASADGSCMVSYAADSHWLFGELYFHKAARWKDGTMLPVYEWDTNKYLGEIPQVRHTYQTVGNMNEHQLIIGETTWGGRWAQVDTTGIMDYGSLIYITLQRARTAREAIDTIVALANRYGYPSEGETFSIADTEEAWIMDLVGKGNPSADAPEGSHPGIVWVARRIPDGYICAHANQARITTFPLDDKENCLYSPDVIDYARSQGWFEGSDEQFSFREAYNPLDFSGARGCESRVWSAFNILGKGTFTFAGPDGEMVSKSSYDWVDYLQGEMPLFIKPAGKVSVKMVADVMRDHFEGTPMDMTLDIGAGGNALPYRWRPMNFESDGVTYVNERAIATQQTGFWFVAQARGFLPDIIGALQWFGCDDAATSYLTPVYAGTKRIPLCFKEGNGDLLHYSPTAAFWICNRVANACYKMYNLMAPVVRRAADEFENEQMFSAVPANDAKLLKLCGKKGKPGFLATRRIRKAITRYTVDTAQQQFERWFNLERLLLVKFIDGNVKAQNEDGSFKHTIYGEGIPDGLEQPGYTQHWKDAVAKDHGETIRVK